MLNALSTYIRICHDDGDGSCVMAKSCKFVHVQRLPSDHFAARPLLLLSHLYETLTSSCVNAPHPLSPRSLCSLTWRGSTLEWPREFVSADLYRWGAYTLYVCTYVCVYICTYVLWFGGTCIYILPLYVPTFSGHSAV